MLKILEQYSNKVYTIPVDHKDYNKFIGIAAKKRKTQKKKLKNFYGLWTEKRFVKLIILRKNICLVATILPQILNS